jgi:hypothetical protein
MKLAQLTKSLSDESEPFARDVTMGRRSTDAYDNALALCETEASVADTFEAEFSIATNRTVVILPPGKDPPDRVALIAVSWLEFGVA